MSYQTVEVTSNEKVATQALHTLGMVTYLAIVLGCFCAPGGWIWGLLWASFLTRIWNDPSQTKPFALAVLFIAPTAVIYFALNAYAPWLWWPLRSAAGPVATAYLFYRLDSKWKLL